MGVRLGDDQRVLLRFVELPIGHRYRVGRMTAQGRFGFQRDQLGYALAQASSLGSTCSGCESQPGILRGLSSAPQSKGTPKSRIQQRFQERGVSRQSSSNKVNQIEGIALIINTSLR